MILVTGATGFTGSHLMKQLIGENEDIRCFVRHTSDISILDNKRVEIKYGSFEDVESYRNALQGVDTLINIASLGFGHAPMIVEEAENAGVRRAVFVSTTALFTNLPAQTKAIRTAAEKSITDSTLNYTIIRPTMIYGTGRDRNMIRLIKMIRRYPVIPIAGNGDSLQQPIHVDDLAEAILKAVKSNNTIRKDYNVSGKLPITYNQVIDQTAEALGKKVWKVHVPIGFVLPLVGLYNRFSSNPRIKVEQILRLNEDKSFDHSDAIKDFGFVSRTFEEGINQEVNSIN